MGGGEEVQPWRRQGRRGRAVQPEGEAGAVTSPAWCARALPAPLRGSATSWAWASVLSALKLGGRGREAGTRRNTPPFTHTHLRTGTHIPSSPGQSSAPCGLVARGPGVRREEQTSHPDAEERVGSPPHCASHGFPGIYLPHPRSGASI